MNKSSISQTVYLDANTYNVSFMAAQRMAIRPKTRQSKSCSIPGKPTRKSSV